MQADLTLRFGGRALIDGTMLYDLRGGRVRIEFDDGGVMVFDGERAWVAPKEAEVERARFHLLTWPYFLAAPFKLDDPGTKLAFGRLRPVDGTLAQTLKLTFEPGTGDTPDDWYVCYVHPQTHRLLAMAYIVTYGTPAEEAEQEPHAIIYRGWTTVDGVTLSTDWTFTHWNEAEGIHGEPIGSAKLANIRFVEPKQGAFDKPADAREDELP